VDPDSKRLVVSVTDGRGRSVRAPGLAPRLERVAPPAARGELAIALVSDRRMRALNRQYRRKDRPTDVLSFEPSDIVIAVDTARRQARETGHSYAVELKILALHGLLHLLGYDHDAPSDRGRMARVERRLRVRGGLRAGLIERTGGAKRPRARTRPGGRGSADEARRPPARRRSTSAAGKRVQARAGESGGQRARAKK
jgi:probable rRNA maturation factor